MGSTIILILLVFAVLGLIGIYNRLVSAKNSASNALANIDVELTRRYDLIPNLAAAAKKYLEHESSVLTQVTAARAGAVNALEAAKTSPSAENLANLANKDQTLNRVLAGLTATFEAYPELKADSQIQNLTDELAETENRISAARRRYNSEVTDYRNTAEQFPNNLLAGFFKFQPAPWLEIDNIEAKREPVKIDLG